MPFLRFCIWLFCSVFPVGSTELLVFSVSRVTVNEILVILVKNVGLGGE